MNEPNELAPQKLAAERIVNDPKADLALSTIAKLSAAGYIAYLAGGCVRDALMGRTPKDYDVATNARPDEIRELFGMQRTLAIGVSFGVVSVLGSRKRKEDPVEVATFRRDGEYSDGRRPDAVEFCSPEQDAQRRDFTINGMFFDPRSALVIDYVAGFDDLQAKLVRAIRDPDERFQEDKLRLLRAVRFAAAYEFDLEPNTLKAIQRHACEVTVCSGERIGAEMLRILSHPNAASGLNWLLRTNLADAIMPELAALLRNDNVRNRIFKLLDRCEPYNFPARLGILLSGDLGNANRNLLDITTMWHLSNDQRDATQIVIDDLDRLLQAESLKWSQLQPLLVKRHADASVAAVRAVASLEPQYDAARQRIDEALRLPVERLDPTPFLTGNDLIEMGLQPGPGFKQILSEARNAQLDGEISSSEEARARFGPELE